jgi:hypothetical protein
MLIGGRKYKKLEKKKKELEWDECMEVSVSVRYILAFF